MTSYSKCSLFAEVCRDRGEMATSALRRLVYEKQLKEGVGEELPLARNLLKRTKNSKSYVTIENLTY